MFTMGPPLWGANAGDPYRSSVVLHMEFEGAHASQVYTDLSSYAHTISESGTNRLSDEYAASGLTSLYLFSGWLTVPDHPVLDLGATWTIEGMARGGSEASGGQPLPGEGMLFNKGAFGLQMRLSLSGGGDRGFRVRASTSGTAWEVDFQSPSGTSYWPQDAWFHWAVVMSGGTISVYLNLVRVAQIAIGGPIAANGSAFAIGQAETSLADSAFYLDSYRVTGSVARYTGATCPAPVLPWATIS